MNTILKYLGVGLMVGIASCASFSKKSLEDKAFTSPAIECLNQVSKLKYVEEEWVKDKKTGKMKQLDIWQPCSVTKKKGGDCEDKVICFKKCLGDRGVYSDFVVGFVKQLNKNTKKIELVVHAWAEYENKYRRYIFEIADEKNIAIRDRNRILDDYIPLTEELAKKLRLKGEKKKKFEDFLFRMRANMWAFEISHGMNLESRYLKVER